MLPDISEIAILVSAILAVAVGSIWYSPIFFGRILSKTVGHVFDDTEESRNGLFRRVCMDIFAQVIFFIFLSWFIMRSEDEAVSLLHIGVALSGLLIAYVLHIIILERRSIQYFLIHAGYAVVVTAGGLAVIAKWPW